MKLLHKIPKTAIDLCIILGAAIGARALWYYFHPTAIYTGNSYGYYLWAQEFATKPLTFEGFFSILCTPGYPLFLVPILILGGDPSAVGAFGNPPFMHTMDVLMFVQALLGLMGLVALYATTRLIGFSRGVTLVFLLFTAMNLTVIPWEFSVMTEGLSMPMLALGILLSIAIIRTPRPIFFLLLSFLFFPIASIHPSLTAVPVIGSLCIAWHHRTKEAIVGALILSLLSLSVPGIYATMNGRLHGYTGMQTTVEINKLGKIMELRIPLDAGAKDTLFYPLVTMYLKNGGDPYPFKFIDTQFGTLYTDGHALTRLAKFTSTIIMHNLPAYIIGSLQGIPGTITQICVYSTAVPPPGDRLGSFIRTTQEVYRAAQIFAGIFYVIVFPGIAVLFIVKRPTFQRTTLMLLGSIVGSQMLVAAFFVYARDPFEEYGRFSAPGRPYLFLFVLMFVIWYVLPKLKRKNQT